MLLTVFSFGQQVLGPLNCKQRENQVSAETFRCVIKQRVLRYLRYRSFSFSFSHLLAGLLSFSQEFTFGGYCASRDKSPIGGEEGTARSANDLMIVNVNVGLAALTEDRGNGTRARAHGQKNRALSIYRSCHVAR